MDIDIPTLIMWAIVGGGGISVLIFVFGFRSKGKRSERIKSVVSRQRGDLSRQQIDNMTKTSSIRLGRSSSLSDTVNDIFRKLNLQDLLSQKEVRMVLSQAGFRGQSVVAVYIASRVLGAIVGFSVTLLYVNSIPEFGYPGFMKLVFAAAAGAAGFYLPRVIVMNTAQKRQQEMTDAFPDTLDLMVICVEAGLAVENAFSRVTDEIMENSPTLAQELGLTSAELAYLGDRRVAYQNFATRTGLPAAKGLATTLIQSEPYGTPVGQALRVLAQEKRDERMSLAEKKAASLPAKLSVPMIIFFLPVLFSVVIGPAAMSIGN